MRRLIAMGAAAAALASAAAAPAQAAYELAVSATKDRSNATLLAGRALAGDAFIFTRPDSAATRVRFWLDDPQRLKSPRKTELNAPWDFAGTAADRTALPFDTTGIGNGPHTITAVVDLATGGNEIVEAAFTVQNALPPDQVHLAWTADPARTLTVVWRTRSTTAPHAVRYRPSGTSTWLQATGAARPSGTAGTLHETMLTGLQPDTAYEYQVPGDGGAWSAVFETRTAPAAVDGAFDAIYYADTGLIGRTDGLATGTQQAIAEIAGLRPLLVLPGGDFAYFDTDKRFSTLERTIDEWFNQQQPVLSRSVAMPTYGNHEALLGEGFDNWAKRFPTPAGLESRRFYSFDVAGVHFVSVFAVQETSALTSTQFAWLEHDIQAARAAGARWIVPYMHVSSFADGYSHPSNLALRRQLGPLFEREGVKLVLTSHDQSFERTWPLTDIGTSNTPTSTSLSCYDLSDGVTWAKVSPAGKLSNKNRDFSKFQTFPPPSWTAVREDTLHHFARLRVRSDALRLETFGFSGGVGAPTLIDSFEYRPTGCPSSLQTSPTSASLRAVEGGAATTATVSLSGSGGQAASFQASDDATWLSVSPASGSTPADLQLRAEPSGLAPGSYRATVTLTAAGLASATLPVTFTVDPDGYQLLASTASSRSNPVALAGRTLSGSAYVFTNPETGASKVSFWLDDPVMSGTARKVEGNAPFDFAGTNTTTRAALPWDTRTVTNGSHTITAKVETTAGGVEILHATFTVAN